MRNCKYVRIGASRGPGTLRRSPQYLANDVPDCGGSPSSGRPSVDLARISQRVKRIGAPNQRKLFCENDFLMIRGEPRCKQSVSRIFLDLKPSKAARWSRRLTVARSRRTRARCCLVQRTGRSEKITINLGYVDLGQVDLMVQEGFYSNRTDFIRTAIRNQLERHADVVKQSTARKSLDLGLRLQPRGSRGRAASR